jgi:hypothetical protein
MIDWLRHAASGCDGLWSEKRDDAVLWAWEGIEMMLMQKTSLHRVLPPSHSRFTLRRDALRLTAAELIVGGKHGRSLKAGSDTLALWLMQKYALKRPVGRKCYSMPDDTCMTDERLGAGICGLP